MKDEQENPLSTAPGVSLDIPDSIDELLADHEDDFGYSDDQADSMVPILGILQDNSGEVKKRHSRHIDGAEAGDLIIRSLGKIIGMADELPPLLVQPCGFDHMWVEWDGEPGEGVPVGQHAFNSMPSDATEQPDPENPDRTNWVRENGNRLVDTRYHYVNVIDDDGSVWPVVIPMSGTNHTVSRQWTSIMKRVRHPRNPAKRAHSFFRMYSLRTAFKQRGEQSWYNYKIEDAGWVEPTHLQPGLELFKAIAENALTPETAGQERTPDDDDGQDSIPI
jgi:hypothetical protein